MATPETEEDKARRERREQIERSVRENATFDIPFLGKTLLLPPQITASIVEFLGHWSDKLVTWVQGLFGNMWDAIQSRTDPKSYAMRKAFPDEKTATSAIKTNLKPALTELGDVANGMDDALAPKIQHILAGATIDANGIEAAGKKVNTEVVALVTKELEAKFGKSDATKAAIEATAKSVAESVQGGVTQYLKAAQQIKGTESLTPEQIGDQISKLKITFDPISQSGRTGISQLKEIKEVTAGQARAMEQAKAVLLADISKEGITITTEQTAMINRLTVSSGFDPKLAGTIAEKFGKEDWLKVFEKSPTAITLTPTGEAELKIANGTFSFRPQGTTAAAGR